MGDQKRSPLYLLVDFYSGEMFCDRKFANIFVVPWKYYVIYTLSQSFSDVSRPILHADTIVAFKAARMIFISHRTYL